jgi:altronate dehydratase
MQPPTTYDLESRNIAKLADEIEHLLDVNHANFSQGAAALLLALVSVLSTIENVANGAPQYAELYKQMPFSLCKKRSCKPCKW